MEYRQRRKMQMYNDYLFKKKPTCNIFEIKFRANDAEENKEVERILKTTKTQPAINRYNYVTEKLKRQINTERNPVYCIDDVPYASFTHRKLTQEIENSKISSTYIPSTPSSQQSNFPKYLLSSSIMELSPIQEDVFVTSI